MDLAAARLARAISDGKCTPVATRHPDKDDLQGQLASLLPLLSPGSDLPPSQAAPAVKAMLEAPPASLLILDNIPSLQAWNDHLASGLLPSGHCHVLLTTREADVLPDRAVQVPRFTTEEAWTILARARPDALDEANVKWVGRVLRAADGLGVAIGAVAARMQFTRGTTWRDYWETLKQAAPAEFADGALPPLVRSAAAEPDDAQKTRWRVLLDDCYDALTQPQQRALEYAALLPQDLTPHVWLTALLDADGSAAPPSSGQSVVQDLLRLQLLTPVDAAGNLLSLHRLWHARVNERVGEGGLDRSSLWSAIAVCAKARTMAIVKGKDGAGEGTANNPAALTDQTLRWELTPLTAVCKALWEGGEPGGAAGLGMCLADTLRFLGRYAEAAACLLPIHMNQATVEQALGSINLASCYSSLAAILNMQGDWPGAQANAARAIALGEQHLAKDHPFIAIYTSILAVIQQNQGDLPSARMSIERAIAIEQTHFPPDHPTLANSLSNLATIQYNQGDFPGARRSLERSIAIKEKHFAPDHPTLATSYSNLAGIQYDEGDLPGALMSIQRSIAIVEENLGAEHPDLVTMRSNLAGIQREQGDLSGARASIERAITIGQKHFAPDHPTFANSYVVLARIQLARDDKPAACVSLKKALAILLKHFDEDHPDVKNVRRGLKIVGCGE